MLIATDLLELLGRERRDVAQYGDARVVDQDVQPAELGDGLLDRPGHLFGVGGVGLDRHDRRAVGGDLGGQLLGLRRGRAVGERDGGAVGGQPPHDLRADSARCSGDQCPTSRQCLRSPC